MEQALLRVRTILTKTERKVLWFELTEIGNVSRIEVVLNAQLLINLVYLFWMLKQEPFKNFHCFLSLTDFENVAHDDSCSFLYVLWVSKPLRDSLKHFGVFFLEIKVDDCFWITVHSMEWILWV